MPPVSKSKVFYALLSTHTLMVIGTTVTIIYTASVAPLGEPLLYLSILLLFLAYYFYGGVLDMRVYRNDSVIHERMIAGMRCLQTRYKPTWYLLNANFQTLFAAAGRPTPDVTFERELVEGVYPDGEICRLDWCNPSSEGKMSNNGKGSSSSGTLPSSSSPSSSSGGKPPVVIIFHGLTGGSDDSNMHYLTQAIQRIGWHVVIPVRRGCGDEATITVPKFYAYGGIEDTAYVVDYIAAKMRGHTILGVGISAGSNILANYLGTLGSRSRIQAAISVANGYCWDKGTRAIREHHPVWDAVMSSIVYHTLFGRHGELFDKHERHVVGEEKTAAASAAVGEGRGTPSPHTPTTTSGQMARSGGDDANKTTTRRRVQNRSTADANMAGDAAAACTDAVLRLKRVGSQREVDEAVSRRLHGFPSLEAFYHHQSCEYRLHNIAVPTIFLNALDDPLASHLNIPTKALQRNPYTLLVTTACGGHLGWAEGWRPFSNTPTWMDRFVVEGLSTLRNVAEEIQRTGRVRHEGGDGTSPPYATSSPNAYHQHAPIVDGGSRYHQPSPSLHNASWGQYAPSLKSASGGYPSAPPPHAATEGPTIAPSVSGAALDSLQSSLTTSPAKVVPPLLQRTDGGGGAFYDDELAAEAGVVGSAMPPRPMLTFASSLGGAHPMAMTSSESGDDVGAGSSLHALPLAARPESGSGGGGGGKRHYDRPSSQHTVPTTTTSSSSSGVTAGVARPFGASPAFSWGHHSSGIIGGAGREGPMSPITRKSSSSLIHFEVTE